MTLSRLFARRSLFVSLSLVMLLAFAIVPAALAGTIVVDANCTDTNLATAVCDDNTTYRTIAGAAAAATAGDTLDVQTTGGHTEAGVTLTKTLTIQGQGQNTTIWQAATGPGLATTRLFTVNPGVAITVTGLTLQYGIATDGGAIYNLRGTLMLSSVNVFTNTSSAGGGAIYNVSSTAGTTATVHITGSVFSGNRSLAFPGGGALTTFTNNATARGVAVITNTQFISNNSSYQGGAILSDANSGTTSLFVTGSTFTRNTTTKGGGGSGWRSR